MTSVTIDRRQRLVTALMIMGFDLPAPLGAAGASMNEAAKVCPKLTLGEVPDMGPHSRRACLLEARRLIDEMLSEIPDDVEA